jgi:hypothetical protein
MIMQNELTRKPRLLCHFFCVINNVFNGHDIFEFNIFIHQGFCKVLHIHLCNELRRQYVSFHDHPKFINS